MSRSTIPMVFVAPIPPGLRVSWRRQDMSSATVAGSCVFAVPAGDAFCNGGGVFCDGPGRP